MDRIITVVAICIKAHVDEGRITRKEADVLVSRMVGGWTARDVPFDIKAFYEACGLKF